MISSRTGLIQSGEKKPDIIMPIAMSVEAVFLLRRVRLYARKKLKLLLIKR